MPNVGIGGVVISYTLRINIAWVWPMSLTLPNQRRRRFDSAPLCSSLIIGLYHTSHPHRDSTQRVSLNFSGKKAFQP